uniref:Ubiquitin-like domain-containing protein n=2 Tax=Meloidogyne incognita group TaxID=654580 RepID=A0A915MG27_MELJA
MNTATYTPRSQETINVIVKDTYNDSKMAVQMEPNGTVLGLKYKISDRRGLPTATQRLIYRGHNLEDNCKLLLIFNRNFFRAAVFSAAAFKREKTLLRHLPFLKNAHNG